MKNMNLIILFLVLSIITILLVFMGVNVYKYNNCEMSLISTKEDIVNMNFLEKDIIGNLKIEKINLNAPIKNGIDNDTLSKYIGHLPDSPYFEGNVCLYAHNSGYLNNYFEYLYKLKNGDIIEYSNEYFTTFYKVINSFEISEDDMTVLSSSEDNILTMITCISGKPDKRLCVVAKEVIL